MSIKIPAQGLRINFLRGDSTNTALKIVDKVMKLGLPIVVVVSLGVFGASFYKFQLDQKLLGITREVSAAAETVNSYAALEKELAAVMSKYKVITDAEERNQITLLLPKLSTVVPNGVRVNDMSVTQDKLSFVGHAVSRDALTALSNNVKLIANELFADGQKVEFSGENFSSIVSVGNEFEFSFSANYKIVRSAE